MNLTGYSGHLVRFRLHRGLDLSIHRIVLVTPSCSRFLIVKNCLYYLTKDQMLSTMMLNGDRVMVVAATCVSLIELTETGKVTAVFLKAFTTRSREMLTLLGIG
jgi:hypothetical protein